MSIGSIQHNTPAPLLPDRIEEAAKNASQEQQHPTPLSLITDTAGFSSVVPKLQAVLDQISTPGASVVDTLAGNVDKLQDGFVDTLYSTLSASGVDLSGKITLRLDADSSLAVTGDHPNKENINALLNKTPELSTAFAEIASQSAALRDIRSLSSMVRHSTGVDCYAAMTENTSDSVYQLSLKGDMSHFYFNPKA